jgi:3',5'-cyclic AMP phosphodiesterase CpdA
MTDFHVWSLGGAPDGMTRALRHAQTQEDPPDIIVNTGDSIMDSLDTRDKGAVEAQWDVYNSILKSECSLPVIHAIGNHDVWGWGHPEASTNSDPLHGKNMALEKLGLDKPYYSFDRAGWHFLVLDSIHLPNEASEYPYIGRLDDEQFKWLTEDINSLADTNTPICILSHIPIVAACEYFDGPNEESGNWVVPGSWMHIDARRFRDTFLQAPNVRLCLSGHTHQYESLDYLGVRYVTSGAVCGNWWKGDYLNFPPAYVMVNLYEDGTADSHFIPYGQV